MKVVLVTDAFTTGGGLEHLYQIVHGMPDIDFVLVGKPGPDQDRFSDIANVEICHGSYFKKTKTSADLIHIHHLKPLLKYFLHPLRSKTPVLFTVHGLHGRKYDFQPGWTNQPKKIMRRTLENWLFRQTTNTISVSRADQDFLKNIYALKNTIYIPNGIVPPVRLTKPPQELRRELGLPIDQPSFLTIARFDLQKGYDLFIEAIRYKLETFRAHRVRFVWVGEGPTMAKCRQRVRQTGVEDLVQFLGWRRDVHKLMQAADLLVLPSRWEGLPLTLIEAAYLNLPMLISNTCGNQEIIEDGAHGRLFENNNAKALGSSLAEAIQERWYTKTTAASSSFLERYHIDNMVRQLRDIYTRISKKQFPSLAAP